METKEKIGELELKVKLFFEEGWKLRRSHEEKNYFIISPVGNAYSAKDFCDEELYTFYDHQTLKEREKANVFCNLLQNNLNLLRTYREFVTFL